MAEISDGTSNTILFVEKAEPFCWMDPTADIQFEHAAREIYAENGTFIATLCDGSVQDISTYIPPKVLKYLFLRNDNQVDVDEEATETETVSPDGPLFSEEIEKEE
ncbi:MAG: hypothetical protein Q4C70_13700 [Planctomycetia bacterium]|nr:hypothetical protein [Planctomycetia bacterium]